MASDPPSLEELAERAHRWGKPVVVALVGSGATGVAAAHVARDPHFVGSLEFRELAPDGPGTLWFHDRRSPVDLVLEGLSFAPRPCFVLLTGMAREAGRLDSRERIAIPEGPAGEGWTTIEVPLPESADALSELVSAARGRRDLALAFAAHDALAALGLSDREMELLRLSELGRYSEVDAVAMDGTPLPPEQLLFLALAALKTTRYQRALNLLDAAFSCRPSPTTAADLEYVRSRLQSLNVHDHVRPADPTLLDRYRFLRWQAGDDGAQRALMTSSSVLGDILLQARDSDDQAPRDRMALDLVRVGQLGLARELCPSAWQPEVAPSTVLQAGDRLLAHDFEAARQILDAQPAVGDRHWAWSGGWLLMRAVAAAVDGDRLAVHVSCAGLSGRKATTPQSALPFLQAAAPAETWCRLHLWTRASDWMGHPTLMVEHVDASTGPAVLGDYELGEPIGKGGMASVFRATFVPTGAEVAIKVIDPAQTRNTELFRREIDIVSRLEHPGIVSVLDFGVAHPLEAAHRPDLLEPGLPFLVMERVTGGSLSWEAGAVPWHTVQAVLLGLLDALAYAHARGVIHRDLKLSNVLIDQNGKIRLSDFGLAGLREERVAGTPAYMAPEQFSKLPIDARADLYALGCLGWALVTGLPPWTGSTQAVRDAKLAGQLPELRPTHDVPEGLDAWLRRLLEKHPAGRPANAAEAAAGLLALAEPVPARSSVPPASPPHETTFVLDAPTQLGLPPDDLVFDQGSPMENRVRRLFNRTHAHRPRLPTTNLLDRGDPDVSAHPHLRDLLERKVLEVIETGSPAFLALVGRRGVGRAHTLQAVRLGLRIQGLDLGDAPREGPALIEAADGSVGDWSEQARGKPWVVVWTHGPPEDGGDIEQVEVSVLSILQLFWLIRSRLHVEPWCAVELARRAQGHASLAASMLRDLVSMPGLGATPYGLQPAAPLPRIFPSELAWWRQAARETPDLRVFRAAAVLAPPFRTETWQAVCAELGAEAPVEVLGRIGTQMGGWFVTPAFRHVLLDGVEPELRRRLHEAAMKVDHPGRLATLRHGRHALLAGGAGGFQCYRDALVGHLRTGRSIPTGFADLFEVHLDLAGTPPTDPDRGWCAAAHLLDERGWVEQTPRAEHLTSVQLAERAAANGWRGVEALAWRLASWEEPSPRRVGRMLRSSVRTEVLEDRLLSLACAIALRGRRGGPWREEVERLDRLATRCSDPDRMRGFLRLTLAHHIPSGDLLPDDLVFFPSQEPAAASLRMHLLLASGRYEEAWALGQQNADLLAQVQSGSGLLNLGAAAAAVGDPSALVHVMRGILHAARMGQTQLVRMAQVLVLVLAHDWPNGQWEEIASVTPPLGDASLLKVVETVVARVPAEHRRREVLETLLANLRAGQSPLGGWFPGSMTRPELT